MTARPDQSTRLLVVEQDRRYGEWLRQHLGVLFPEWVIGLSDFREFENWYANSSAPDCDILLLSSGFGSGPEDPQSIGLEQLRRLRARRPKPVIIAIAEGGNELTAVRALHLGAIDYLPRKLLTPERLAAAVKLAMRRLAKKEARRLGTTVALRAAAAKRATPAMASPPAATAAPPVSTAAVKPAPPDADLGDDTNTALDAVADFDAQAILEGGVPGAGQGTAAGASATATRGAPAATTAPAGSPQPTQAPVEPTAFLPYGIVPAADTPAGPAQTDDCAPATERPAFLPYGSEFEHVTTDTISRPAPLSKRGVAEAQQAMLDAEAPGPVAAPSGPALAADFLPGYTIHGIVGESEKATVYVASSHELGFKVAVKVSKTLRDDTAGRQFLEREYRAIVAIRHPAVVRIFDYGVQAGFEFLVMEYLPLGDLKARMSQGVTEPEALLYVQQIAVGLRVVHHAGLLHRDLKPPNVMLRDSGDLALIDFGLARALDGSTPSTRIGVLRGSPYYMSPEQAQGEPLDARSDFYSLGVIFYEMLTGNKPYTGATAMDVLHQHVHAPVPELPRALAQHQPLLARMLAKTPGERFGSASELIAAVTTARELSQLQPSAA